MISKRIRAHLWCNWMLQKQFVHHTVKVTFHYLGKTRQSFLLLSELPARVTVFEQCFEIEYSESYTGNIQGDARIEGYEYCMPLGRALETVEL